ncbi:MAG: polysaccharide deacetylase family protein, partial [Sneathiella sp.]
MTFAKRIISKFDRNFARYISVNSKLMTFEKPIVSFTFDDCPRSAITVGAKMLKDRGVQGTFYLCGALTSGHENGLSCQTEDDLAYLVENGHELASHLFNHKRCEELSEDQLASEIKQSKNYLYGVTGRSGPLSFSYPFGSINLRAKKMVAEQFVTGRGINPGVNAGKIDLSCLKANALYEGFASEKSISDLIDEARQKVGWLILYTHDVQEAPSPYGVKPKTL